MMKIGIVYTSTTPELIETVEREIKTQFVDCPVEFISVQDPSILNDTIAAGFVPPAAIRRLVRLYLDVAEEGADLILSVCSSVGEVAGAAEPLFCLMGVPLIRIDQLMVQTATAKHERIAVLATLPSTLEPTMNLVRQSADQFNKSVKIVPALAEGGFGLPPDEFQSLLYKTCEPILDQVDAILLAQGSMAYCEEWLRQKVGKPVYSSPRFAALALKQAAEQLKKCPENV